MSDISIHELGGDFNNPTKRHGSVRETSIAALESLDPETLERNRLRILCFIVKNGSSTCDEIEAATGMKHQSVSALITRLSKQGRLIDTGERRLTRSGRPAIVWGVAQ